MADHGARSPLTSIGIDANDSSNRYSFCGRSLYPVGAYNPLFLIKTPYSNLGFEINNSPILLTDVRDIVNEYIRDGSIINNVLHEIDRKKNRKLILYVKYSKTRINYAGYIVKENYGTLESIPDILK